MVRGSLGYALVLGFLLLVGLGTAAEESRPEVSETLVIWPPGSLTGIGNASSLAGYLSTVLGLPPVAANRTVTNPSTSACCLRDWQNHTVPLANESSILAFTEGGHSIWLEYSEGGSLAFAKVNGLFGDELASNDTQSMFDRLETIATSLGIATQPRGQASWTGTSMILVNNSTLAVQSVTVVTYGFFEGDAVAFGNELRVTFSLPHRRPVEVAVFPWFTADPAPLTKAQAFSIALDHLNQTQAGEGEQLHEGQVYWAFDSVRYSPTFQVEATYIGPTVREFRVWVNAYSGGVDYVAELVPHPAQLGRPSGLSWPLLLGFVLVPFVLALGLARAYEPLGVVMFSVLGMIHTQIRRDEALDHFVRGQIYAYVVLNPGASYSEIRDAFSLRNGTTSYHLVVLESLGFVKSVSDGRYKRFLPQESGPVRLGRKLTDLQMRILETASVRGSVGPSELARSVEVSRQRAAYNVRKLVRWGLLADDPEHRGKYLAVRTGSPSENQDSTPDS